MKNLGSSSSFSGLTVLALALILSLPLERLARSSGRRHSALSGLLHAQALRKWRCANDQ